MKKDPQSAKKEVWEKLLEELRPRVQLVCPEVVTDDEILGAAMLFLKKELDRENREQEDSLH